MTCEEVKINLPEFIDGKLQKGIAEVIESHLEGCNSCRELFSELNSFLKFTDSFQDIETPQGMKEEFLKLAELQEFQVKKKAAIIPYWIKVAAMIIVVFGTFISGYFVGFNGNEKKQLQAELNSLKQKVLLAGLQDYSGPQKIAAVYSIKTSGQMDDNLIEALVNTMNSDKNINVRLAAINALSGMIDKNEKVKNELINSLSLQENPLLQISLIQILTESGVKEAKEPIESLSDDENTDKNVKEYAKNMIKTII
jgi:hypothetical protein